MGGEIAPVIWDKPLALLADDVLVLCSDGLTDGVSDTEIAEIAGRLPPGQACEALIAAALAAGGHDNISVGLVRVGVETEQTARSGQTTRRLRPDAGQTRRVEPANHGMRHDG